ncbi:hypothetical protein F4811DRAFT_506395 [Daldinia bambusicola]|nr:hypothetical protein F4811DRAFT_506395 [Daldinia bambusicola]
MRHCAPDISKIHCSESIATMSGTSKVNFDHLKKKADYLGDTSHHIIDLLALSLEQLPMKGPAKTAHHFVQELVEYSSLDNSGLQPKDFVWEFWEALIDIASQIPPRTLAQDVLFEIVISLEKIGEQEKADNQMWKNLPNIGIAVRDNWNRIPTLKPDPDDSLMFTEPEWLNLNSFVARLYGKQRQWGKYMVWGLRNGLETPTDPIQDMPSPETRIRVAIEWIFQSSRRIFLDSIAHTFSDYQESLNMSRPYRGGPLFSGASGCSLERWCFWKSRLVAIRTEVDESLHPAIDKATKAMIRAEKKLGKQIRSVNDLSDSEIESEVKPEIEEEANDSAMLSSKEPGGGGSTELNEIIEGNDILDDTIMEGQGYEGDIDLPDDTAMEEEGYGEKNDHAEGHGYLEQKNCQMCQ